MCVSFFAHSGNNCTTLKSTSGTSWFSTQIVSSFALTSGFVSILLVRCPNIYLLVPFGTVLDDFIANFYTLTFKMPVGTRLNPRRSMSEEDICQVTNFSPEALIRENADIQRMQLDCLRNMAQSLEKIAQSMTDRSSQDPWNSANICQKIDGLVRAIQLSNAALTPSLNDIDGVLKHRKTLVEKIARHELLSEYYDELLNEEKPFVRKALRTKVNQNASEIDLRHRCQQTVNSLKIEIKIMQDCLIEFGDKKRELEEKIESFLQKIEDQHMNIAERLTNDDQKAKKDYQRKISLMRNTDSQEKKTLANYLLKFQGEKSDNSNSGRSKLITPTRYFKPHRSQNEEHQL